MSVEKNMNTRIQHKHDIEANWNKAINFIPKIGEIIIYDIDENHNYSRFKIGDGVRTISNLEFSQTDLTGYATESYVNSTITSLVNAAPEALNTLNELAAALGDDPNFATTIATEIGKKVDKETGKGLSTNDFTNNYKNILDNLGSMTFEETDPTVPAWAKAETKPVYTADEVSAVSTAEQNLDDEQKIQARANIGAVSMEEVEELLGIEEVFSATGDVAEFNFDVEPDTALEVISKIHRDETWGLSDKLVLHQVSGSNFVDLSSWLGGVGTVFSKNGVTATINADSTVTILGTNENTGWGYIINKYQWSGEHSEKVYPAGTYTIPAGFNIAVRAAQYPNNNTIAGATGNLGGTVTIPEPFRIIFVMYAVRAGATVDLTLPLGLFRGNSVPETGYEYHGNIHTVTFDTPVYDGEFNWSTGELKDADGNTVGYYDVPEIKRLPGTNYFWTCFGENTVSNASNDLSKAVLHLNETAPEETIPSICDFTLTPVTKNYSINVAGDNRNFFGQEGNLFYGMEVPLITTRGKFVVTNSDGLVECELTVPELINHKNIADIMTSDSITKRWSNRFYIIRDPDVIETVDDGSGSTNENPNTIYTWIFPKKEFEKYGLPIESTDIPIVSPVFSSVTNDELASIRRSYGGVYTGAFSYDAENGNYIFKCRARQIWTKVLYKWTSAYFCYPLKEEVTLSDNMLSLYLAAGYSVRFEQDDAFDVFWDYSLTQTYCPFADETRSSLWKTLPTSAESVESLIDTAPNIGIFVPRSVEDALYEAEHIAKRLNHNTKLSDDYEVNSYNWIGEGDGVTDYTDKIQSKLTEVRNTTNGGTIYLGTGTYPISKSLIVYGNTTIIGCGIKTVIKQTADNTDAIIVNGDNIVLKDFCIKLDGACTELTACIYANSNNSNGDNGYPANFYVNSLTMDNIRMTGNYNFEYVDGIPILGDIYNNYKGVGIRSAGMYFNYAHVYNVYASRLMAAVHNGGGGNYYNIIAESVKYAVYYGGINCQYFIGGHSYYELLETGGYVSMCDYVVYERGHNNKYSLNLYDCQHFKSYFYFDGRSQNNSYTINDNYGNTIYGNSTIPPRDNGQKESMAIDLGRGNIQVAAYQNIPFAIGNNTRQLSGTTSIAVSDPAIRNALSGAGVWGHISSNVAFNGKGIELTDICRYPSEKMTTASGVYVPHIVSSISASETNPVEIEIDISNRPIYGQLGYFIQFDNRYVATDYTVSYDTTGDGTYNLSYEVTNNTNVTVYSIRHQETAHYIYRIKFTFTKPLQIENFTYEDSGYTPHTINYNPDGLIGICNIGMTVNDYAGRSFLGECGGSLYGNVDMHQNTLKNLPEPIDDGDVVNKAYVDTLTQGITDAEIDQLLTLIQ